MNQSKLEEFDALIASDNDRTLWNLYCETTGENVLPEDADDRIKLDFVDRALELSKQHLIQAFKKRVAVIYNHIDVMPKIMELIDTYRQRAEEAKLAADIGGYHNQLNAVKAIESFVEQNKALVAESADLLLEHSHGVNARVTTADVADMLDLPLNICEEFASEHEDLLSGIMCAPPHGVDDRYQRFSGYMWEAMWRRIKERPVIHRQMNKYANEILGQPVLPIPEVPKPSLVK